MRQIVHKTEISDVSKPVLASLVCGSEKLPGNVVEDVTMQEANHPKECELLQVKQSLARKPSSQEKDNRFRSLWVELKEAFSCFFHIFSKNINVRS